MALLTSPKTTSTSILDVQIEIIDVQPRYAFIYRRAVDKFWFVRLSNTSSLDISGIYYFKNENFKSGWIEAIDRVFGRC